MKHAIIALVAALAACSPAPTLTREAIASAYQVIRADGKGTGSGVVVSCEWHDAEKTWHVVILTAKHVIEGTEAFRVRNEFGVELVAGLLASSDDQDAALLLARSDVEVPVARIASKEALCGDDVVHVGWPLSEFIITKGVISHATGVSCPVFFGASGGPLWTAEGLVGIVVAVQMAETSFGLRVPLTHMTQFLPIEILRAWIANQGIVLA